MEAIDRGEIQKSRLWKKNIGLNAPTGNYSPQVQMQKALKRLWMKWDELFIVLQ